VSEETIAILRRGHDAFSRGDISVVINLVTPDVEWGATGIFPGLEGTYRGRDSIQDWANTIRTEWEGFEVALDEIVRDQDDVLVACELLRGRGRSSHADVEMRIFSVYWFEEGKIRKRQPFTERHAALEAAGLSE
jgi:ketosteroid isomerase-like protein